MKTKTRFRASAIGGTAMMLVLAAGNAEAQSGAPAATAPDTAETQQVQPTGAQATTSENTGQSSTQMLMGDVIVTGRKRARAEVLQATPISASAVTSQQMEAAAAVNLIDVSRLTPGVSFQQANNPYHNDFQMRGMGVAGTSPQDEPPVGIIYDGIYLGTGAAANLDLFDAQDVVILRGPQGTLFGRNVTGGAVVINSGSASFTQLIRLTGSYSKFDDYEGSAVLNGGLVGDVVAGRLSVRRLHNGGWAKNPILGRNQGESDDTIIRGALLVRPTDTVDVNLKVSSQYIEGDAQPIRGVVPNRAPASNAISAPAYSYPQARGFSTPSDYWTVLNSGNNFQIVRTLSGIGQADWRVLDGVFTALYGYREVETDSSQGFDGTPAESFRSGGAYRQYQHSGELRFAQEIGILNYTVGAYYFFSKLDSAQRRTLNSNTVSTSAAVNPICATALRGTTPLCVTGVTSSDNVQRALQATESTAFFGEADLRITDRITLTAGIRQTHETKRAIVAGFKSITVAGDCTTNINNCRFGPKRRYSANNWSPKAGLSFQVTPQHLLFGSVVKGFRSGGYALRGADLTFAPYDAEHVTAYELGSKNDFANGRLRVNVTGFLSKYKDLQRTVTQQDPQIGIIQSTFNAADATIYGIELETAAQLSSNWSINAVYGYVHAQYDSFVGLGNAFAPIKDLKFNRVPDHTAGGSINYDAPLGTGKIAARVGASYTSQYFFDDANTPSVEQKAYTLVDATLAYTTGDDAWTFTLWGKNLNNAKYAQAGANLGGNGQNYYIGRPANYGIRIARKF